MHPPNSVRGGRSALTLPFDDQRLLKKWDTGLGVCAVVVTVLVCCALGVLGSLVTLFSAVG